MAADGERLAVLEAKVQSMEAVLVRVLDRLLDATLPTAGNGTNGDVTQPAEHEEHQSDDGSYDPARDWTDPFIGLEDGYSRDYREVARLEVGETPPFVPQADVPDAPDVVERWRELGEGAFDEWNRDTHYDAPREMVGWVAPLDLGGEMVP